MGRFGNADEIIERMRKARELIDRHQHIFHYGNVCVRCNRSRAEIVNLDLRFCEGFDRMRNQTARR